MSAHFTLDPESFQNLLASAFVVQESLMDTQSLSAIVEVRHLIVAGKLDVDGAMHLIADRARNVANATGVAVGLLKGDQLVYRAGSGSAATYIGRHVIATLSVSAETEASREILRVENAQTDARIEAAICRQFGAKSLLILPIYHDRAVAGVLEVLFSEAHAFQDREVRTYQLMARVVGEAMSHAGQLEQKKALAAELSTMPQAIPQITPQMRKFLNGSGSPANKHAIFQACGAVRASPAGAATMITHRAKPVPLHKRLWKVAGAAVVTVLVIASWIAYSYRRPASPLGASARQRSNAIDMEEARKAARSTPQRVRVGDNELDYVTEDVTVRYFTPKPTRQQVRVRDSQVDYISEDVTVHYFTPKPAPQRVRVGDNRVE